jgi:hypothetical protein
MTHPVLTRARTVLFALLAFSPAFLMLRLIGRYGVDVPVAVKAEMFCSVVLALLASGGVWYFMSRMVETSFDRKLLLLPWVGIGAFVLTDAALAAVTRIGFGVNQGLDSRYTTFFLYISISIIGMFALVTTKIQSDPVFYLLLITGGRAD